MHYEIYYIFIYNNIMFTCLQASKFSAYHSKPSFIKGKVKKAYTKYLLVITCTREIILHYMNYEYIKQY